MHQNLLGIFGIFGTASQLITPPPMPKRDFRKTSVQRGGGGRYPVYAAQSDVAARGMTPAPRSRAQSAAGGLAGIRGSAGTNQEACVVSYLYDVDHAGLGHIHDDLLVILDDPRCFRPSDGQFCVWQLYV